MKVHFLFQVTIFVLLKSSLCIPSNYKSPKSLFYDLVPNGDYGFNSLTGSNYDHEDDVARAVPSSLRPKNSHKMVPADAFNSPIYYIALPPQPYVFIPGMGYMPQPAPTNPVGDFLNLPVNFLANGKPSNIYQWSANPYNNMISQERPTTQRPQETTKPTDSPIINLDNKFVFNGKPGDTISLLRDSYNALYSDALQNFYP